MSRLRVTIAQLMAFVFYFGFGFAALRNANPMWASATFSLAILAVSVALAGACSMKEGRACLGRDSPSLAVSPCDLALDIFDDRLRERSALSLALRLQPYINPEASGGRPFIAYTQISHALDVILLGCLGAIIGRLLATKDERPNP